MEKNTIIGIIIGAAVGIWLLLRFLRKRAERLNTDPNKVNWKKMDAGVVETGTQFQQTTAKGARVFTNRRLTVIQLNLIDAGLDDAERDAIASGYKIRLPHSFFEIAIPKLDCIPAPESGDPGFVIRADNFDGTEYDTFNPKGKGVMDGVGVIFAAEMVVNVGSPDLTTTKARIVVCPNREILRNGVRFGAEHIWIARNDAEYYLETESHRTRIHPLLPK